MGFNEKPKKIRLKLKKNDSLNQLCKCKAMVINNKNYSILYINNIT